jgi:LysM repeat protein
VTITPVVPSSGLAAGTTLQYKVVQGEWLIQIARCFGADPAAIAKANPQVIDPDELDPGQTLTVPNIGSSGRIYGPPCIGSHTVQSGDTWNSIAAKYNADVVVLQMANKGASLTAGTVLRIPLNSAGTGGTTGPTQAITPIVTACNQAQLVADVNIPDGTSVTAGSTFTKTWRLKNVGTCTWTPSFTLIFDRGERMDAPASTALTTANVAPGGTVDVSVPLRAPAIAGTYQADFRLRAADGATFGIGANGQSSFWVKIVVPATGGTLVPTSTTPVVTLTATSTTTSGSLPPVVTLLGRRMAGDAAVAQFLAANTDGLCPETQVGSRVLECRSQTHQEPYIRLRLAPTGTLNDAPIQEVRIFPLFTAALPEGLTWNMTKAEIEQKLGAPIGTPQDNGNGTVDIEYNTAGGTYRLWLVFDTNPALTATMRRMRIEVK